MVKKTIFDFKKMVAIGDKISFLTGYDYLTAKYEERAGIDMILVGDSLGNVQLGYNSTIPATMDEMISHASAVRRGAPNTFIIGDMPYMSYQISDEIAITNAGRFIKESGCDSVKVEGSTKLICDRVKAIVGAGILVMGHVGLTPQYSAQLGGLKAQGRTADAALKLIEDAKRLEEAGCWSILVEGVPAVVGKAIKENTNIPILGIGSGSYVDGQLLIYADMLGYYDDFTPKFVKKYCNLGEIIQKAFEEYISEIKEGKFPDNNIHSYKISSDEEKDFLKKMTENNKTDLQGNFK